MLTNSSPCNGSYRKLLCGDLVARRGVLLHCWFDPGSLHRDDIISLFEEPPDATGEHPWFIRKFSPQRQEWTHLSTWTNLPVSYFLIERVPMAAARLPAIEHSSIVCYGYHCLLVFLPLPYATHGGLPSSSAGRANGCYVFPTGGWNSDGIAFCHCIPIAGLSLSSKRCRH